MKSVTVAVSTIVYIIQIKDKLGVTRKAARETCLSRRFRDQSRERLGVVQSIRGDPDFCVGCGLDDRDHVGHCGSSRRSHLEANVKSESRAKFSGSLLTVFSIVAVAIEVITSVTVLDLVCSIVMVC